MHHLKSFFLLIVTGSFLLCASCAHNPSPDFVLLPDEPPPAPKLHHPEVALVLSGGGARALAHAGVIEVLEKNHIPISVIVGSSAGSLIGAIYADDPNAKHLKEKIIALGKWDLLDLSWYSSVKMLWRLGGPVQGNALKSFVQKNIKAKEFKDLKIPLVVVTTDVDRGDAFVLRSGALFHLHYMPLAPSQWSFTLFTFMVRPSSMAVWQALYRLKLLKHFHLK